MKLCWLVGLMLPTLICASISLAKNLDFKDYFSRAQDGFLRKGTITPPLVNKTVAAGRGVAFHCRVAGKNIQYKIKWKKDGVSIEEDGRVRISRQNWGSRLRIKDTRKDDEGMYQCIVKARNGQKFTSDAWLEVKGSKTPLSQTISRCVVYKGSICKPYVSSNVSISSSKQQYVIEKDITEIVKYHDQERRKGRCHKKLLPFLCLYFFPPCGSKKVCREQCRTMEKKTCRKSLRNIHPFSMEWSKFIQCNRLPSGGKGRENDCLKPESVTATLDTTLPATKNICLPYTGSLCSDHVTPGSHVLTTSFRSQSEAEYGLRRALHLLLDYTSVGCAKIVRKALCRNMFSSCTNNAMSRPARMCRDDCEMLYSTGCSKEFILLRILERDHPFIQRILPDCSLSPSNGEKCWKLVANGTTNQQGRAPCPSYPDKPFVGKTTVTPVKTWSRQQQICGGRRADVTDIPNAKVLRLIRQLTGNFSKGDLFLSNGTDTKLCLKLGFHFDDLLKHLNNVNRSVDLPNLEGVFDVGEVSGLEISATKTTLESLIIPIGSAAAYQVHERIRLENVTFFYRHQSGRGSIIARGLYDLCKTSFHVIVERLRDGTVKVSGDSTAPIDVENIEGALGIHKLDPVLYAVTQSSLWESRLMKPKMEAYVGEDFSAKFSGNSYLGPEAKRIHLELSCRKLRECDFTAGLTSDDFSLQEVIRIFTAFDDLPSLDVFTQDQSNSRVGVSLSTASVNITHHPNAQFQRMPLSAAFAGSVPQGLGFVSRNTIPRFCSGSTLCQLLQLVFGAGNKFTTSASVNGGVFQLSAEFDAQATAPFHRMDMTLKSEYPQMAAFGRFLYVSEGTIFSSKRQPRGWPFTGHLEYNGFEATLKGSFQTNVAWSQAFGIKHLTIKNSNIGILLGSAGSSQENHVSMKADFEYGVGCTPTTNRANCITGDAMIGLSDNPTEHYLYGNVHDVNLRKLISAFGFNLKLPNALASTGFPRGLQVSIAKQDHDLRIIGGPYLPAGFMFEGKMKILGILTDVSIYLKSTEFSIDTNVSDDPKQDGTAGFSRKSREESSNGPKFVLRTRVNPDGFSQSEIDGYARLLGVFDEMRTSVTRDITQLYLVTHINKSLHISLHLDANYSSSSNSTHFTTKITFQNGLTKLTRLVSKHVVNMLEAEMSRLKSAELEVRHRREKCHAAVQQECDKCAGDVSCGASLSKCHEKVDHERNPGKHLHKVNGAVCRTMVLNSCQNTSGPCHATCHAIYTRANASCYPMEVAERAQKSLKQSLKWVHEADTHVGSNLFKIHAMKFEAALATDDMDGVSVKTTMDVTVFGKKHSLGGLELGFHEFAKLASEIAKHAIDWYQKSQPDSETRHPDNRPRPSTS